MDVSLKGLGDTVGASGWMARVGVLKREILILLIVLSSTIVLQHYVFKKNIRYIRDKQAEAVSIESEINRMKRDIMEMERAEGRLRSLERNLKRLEGRFMLLQGRLPSEKQLSGILKEFTTSGSGQDVEIKTLRPMEMEDMGEYFRLPFQVAMETRFTDFGNYLYRLENLPKIVTIENFRIESKKGSLPGAISVQLFISTYMMGAEARK